jgi:RNA polymerase sigma factor (sigma-70 family)
VIRTAATPLNIPLLAARMEQADPPAALLTLTTGLARGDDPAWAQFHRDYGPGLFRYLLGATRGDYDLAAEALQQTYLRVARYARPCDSAPMFGSWLRVVAGSVLNDCRRRRRSFRNLLHRPEARSEESAPDDANEERLFTALDAALAQLSVADRSLLEEKYLAGSDVRTLAGKLGVTPKAVESRLTRARAELHRHLIAALPRNE